MEIAPVYRYYKQFRTAMVALMAWVVVASSATLMRAEDEQLAEKADAPQGLRLPARSVDVSSLRGDKTATNSHSLLSSTISLGLIVVSILVGGRWLKRSGWSGAQMLPSEAFELLGKRVIEPRVSVHLVRCGSRVLVLGVGTDGVRTLSEIDNPTEVEQLTVACQGASALGSASDRRSELEVNSEVPNSTSWLSRVTSLKRSRLFFGLFSAAFVLMNLSPLQAQATRRGEAANQSRIKNEEPFQGEVRPKNVRQAAFEQQTVLPVDAQQFLSPQQMGLSLKMLVLMTVVSLVPSILMMTTSFVRFTVVLGLLRQALGTQQGPPNQVMSAICLFLTILVMSPVWQRSYDEGIRPYTDPAPGEPAIDQATALSRTVAPVRTFMSQQIERAGNSGIVWMLHDFQRQGSKSATTDEPQEYDDVSLTVLAPAYLLSELKVGFLIGFQLFLPFLVIDLVVAVVLASLGLTMMPPTMVSLPFKLLLFVLIDGWFLTVGMLLESVKVA